MEEKNRTCQTPKEDLMNDALKHYEEASTAIHHWKSGIPQAIRHYYKEDTKQTNYYTICISVCVGIAIGLFLGLLIYVY